MALCKFCLVYPKPCADDCKDYEENKDFEYLEIKNKELREIERIKQRKMYE